MSEILNLLIINKQYDVSNYSATTLYLPHW